MSDMIYDCPDYPLLLILSGPSGVGKVGVARMVIERRPDSFYFVVTATTRPPRDDEHHGVDYIFVTFDEFARMIEANELLEYAVVYNDYKGIPKQQIRDALSSGRDVILRVDVQGAATVRRLIPNAISVFLTTRSEQGLVRRLRQRKQDTAEGMALRTATARQKAVQQVLSIIDAAHCRINQEPVVL